MPGLVPGIHVLLCYGGKDVDGRDKPGHDVESIGLYEGKCVRGLEWLTWMPMS